MKFTRKKALLAIPVLTGCPEWDLIILYAGCNMQYHCHAIVVLCSFVRAVQWEVGSGNSS